MDLGIIITGHGSLPSGILSALDMVAGKSDLAYAIDFESGDNFEDLDKQYLEAYENLSSTSYVLVLSDIQGGTPFNRAYLTLKAKGNVRFLSGVNFYMAYQALNLKGDDIDDLIDSLIARTKDYILEYK